jgi:phenylalanyl-tRNA synthetase beta chain
MPTLAVDRDVLFTHLGHTYTDDEFDELCFLFGVELDEITSEREEALKSSTAKLAKAELEKLSERVLYKIDVPANRYDLLCIEGLVRALKIFNNEMDTPRYTLSHPGDDAIEKMTVMTDNTSTVRPFVVCAILRDVTFTPERYQSFIELQDQLHRNLCRNRTLVAIGTHDLDTIEGPFKYDARPPADISFVPLTHSTYDGNAKELLDLYVSDPTYKHLKPFVPIIYDSPLYPVVLDKNETVMSLPPLINGSHSKITLETTNVFVECTATDLTKANIVLDTMVCMFSEYCATPFQMEPVQVNYVHNDGSPAGEKSYVTPELLMRKERATVSFVNSLIGIDISAAQMVKLCEKLQLSPAQVLTSEDGKDGEEVLEVTVPPTRSDILHAVDIAEDIGIAFGYNNIHWTVPKTSTVGGEQPLNHLGDLLREEVSKTFLELQ